MHAKHHEHHPFLKNNKINQKRITEKKTREIKERLKITIASVYKIETSLSVIT